MKLIVTVMALAAVVLVLSATVVVAMAPHMLVADPSPRPIAKGTHMITADTVRADMGPRKYVSGYGLLGVDVGLRKAL